MWSLWVYNNSSNRIKFTDVSATFITPLKMNLVTKALVRYIKYVTTANINHTFYVLVTADIKMKENCSEHWLYSTFEM